MHFSLPTINLCSDVEIADYMLHWLTKISLVPLYFIALAIYRLYFHPLSKIPGPKLAALTDYWELYQDFFREETGHLFIELDSLHDRYGLYPSVVNQIFCIPIDIR